MLKGGADGGAVEIIHYAYLGGKLERGDGTIFGYKRIADAMAEIGGIGECAGHGTLVGIQATVVAVGVEILATYVDGVFRGDETKVLSEHIALGDRGRRRGRRGYWRHGGIVYLRS